MSLQSNLRRKRWARPFKRLERPSIRNPVPLGMMEVDRVRIRIPKRKRDRMWREVKRRNNYRWSSRAGCISQTVSRPTIESQFEIAGLDTQSALLDQRLNKIYE